MMLPRRACRRLGPRAPGGGVLLGGRGTALARVRCSDQVFCRAGRGVAMRAVLLSLLLVATAWAGCTGTDSNQDLEPEPRVLPTTLETPTLHPPILLGKGPGEPNVATAPDGTIYAVPINDVYRSTDGGASFELAKVGLDGGGDGDLAVDMDGRLHWLGLFGDAGPIPYQRSQDQGSTWTDSIDISDDSGFDREWIEARQDTRDVYAAWRDNAGGGSIAFRSSEDGGRTWFDVVIMSDDAVGGPLAVGPVVGQVYQAHATFATNLGGDASIRLARSSDHGETWEVVPVLTPAQSVQFGLIGFPFSIFPVVTVDEAGTLYLVYAVDQSMVPGAPKPLARFGVYLQVSSDEGDSWSEPQLLSDPNHAAIMPWAAAGAPGRLAVAWYENTAGLPHDNLPDVWNVNLLEMLDANGTQPQTELVQLNDGPVHIGSICTSGTGCLVTGGDRSLLDFLDVALTPAGQPVVVWASTAHPYEGFVQRIDIYARAVADGTPLR